jgi:L-serine dehydratase
MTFRGFNKGKEIATGTYYSIGGGFIVQENDDLEDKKEITKKNFPFPIKRAIQLEEYCKKEDLLISDIVLKNELELRPSDKIDYELNRIWDTMLESMYIGCHTEGVLPGGLNVKRRSFSSHQKLIKDTSYTNTQEWITSIRSTEVKFREILKWVSCFALSVNEVNAALGRIVTAPTNGSAGVIPAVLMYYLVIENHEADFSHIKKFLLTAGEIGSVFKKNATISAAMGGCQAEIGVSSAMAAAALTELLGGTPAQSLVAAEIAMEHHLGLTCDPIGGLVQIPCIERNAMGAIKAISAAEIALETNPKEVKVPLDKVIDTMWETAKDMHKNYKETSEGGLAVNVGLPNC